MMENVTFSNSFAVQFPVALFRCVRRVLTDPVWVKKIQEGQREEGKRRKINRRRRRRRRNRRRRRRERIRRHRRMRTRRERI
jgi:hypothetical protein